MYDAVPGSLKMLRSAYALWFFSSIVEDRPVPAEFQLDHPRRLAFDLDLFLDRP